MKFSAAGLSGPVKINVFRLRAVGFTAFALSAFAANSVICRLALGGGVIDAAGFTTIRLLSGALVLWPISVIVNGKPAVSARHGSWTSAAMLFLYAVAFSFAYLGLSAGTGALILFGAVQVTMLMAGILQGERLGRHQWVGLLVALSGLLYLVIPGWQAPPIWASVLMATAGAAWGIYSLRGRGTANPIAATGGNFLRTLPMAAGLALAAIPVIDISAGGASLAVASGALTSGLGYVLWYAALRDLSATRAATVQLMVPVLAALGGVAFLSEQFTLRLIISSVLIIGGVATTLGQYRKPQPAESDPADPENRGRPKKQVLPGECLCKEPCRT